MTTARTIDQNGYIEIKSNPISRVGIYQYQGEMIGGEEGRIYNVLRSADELSRPETLDSLRLMPFTDGHMMLGEGEEAIENFPAYGTTGEDVYFNPEDGTLYANIKIWSQQLMDKIDGDGIKEISAGYKADHAIFEKEIKADYEFADGEFNGQPFDAIQVNIRFNHVALVENGRMGSTVAILDKADITGAPKMTHQELLKTILKMLQEFAEQEQQEPHEQEDVITLEGEDGPILDEDDKDKDDVKDEFPPKDDDKEKVEDKCDTMDEEEEPKEPEKKEGAKVMDANDIIRIAKKAALREMQAAGDKATLADKLIKAGVGYFSHDSKTMDEVIKYGVTQLGLKCQKGHEATALKCYLDGVEKASKAHSNVMDSFDIEPAHTQSSIDTGAYA